MLLRARSAIWVVLAALLLSSACIDVTPDAEPSRSSLPSTLSLSPKTEPQTDHPVRTLRSPEVADHNRPENKTKKEARGHKVLVTRAVDGDTIEVRMGGKTVDIRLIGIDTPESVAPGQPVMCFGKEASAFTAHRLEGRHVRLTFDVERKDYYGRTLAYVWSSGMFNMKLVRAGFATAYPYEPNTRHADRFAAAERRARKHHRGLWKACKSGGGGGSGGGGSGGSGGEGGCDPSYPTVCIPKYPPDLDCSQIPEHNFKVVVSDPHNFDGNGDGRGCE